MWAAVGQVFFSYIGFDSVSTLAGEVAKPGRDLPIGIVGTLGIVTALYITVGLVLTGMQPYYLISTTAPLADAFTHWGWARTIIAFGSVTTITATTLASLIGQPRIFYQMAKDGLMFPIFGKVNKKTGVPVEGTLITGLVSAVIALFFDLDVLLNMISIGTLLAFTVVCSGVLIMRYQNPDPNAPPRERFKLPVLVIIYIVCCLLFSARNKLTFTLSTTYNIISWVSCALPLLVSFISFFFLQTTSRPTKFSTPLVPFVPCAGIAMNVWFILSLDIASILRLIVWTIIGMAIYLGYGIRHSVLNKTE